MFVQMSSYYVNVPLLVLIGPPLIAKTSFNVQPSAMLQKQSDDQNRSRSEHYCNPFTSSCNSNGLEGNNSRQHV